MSTASAAGRRLDLCDPATVRAVARRAGIASGRRLGQHFLVDRSVLDAIVSALDPGPDDEVLEVGPGIGTLTRELARRARRVVAVDVDAACVRACEMTLARMANVERVHADALWTAPWSLGMPPGWFAAGNIPYSMTTALLTHLLESSPPPARGVFLVQREVAERLAAPPGGWSLATVAVRSLAAAERLADVPPGSFAPPPAVHSSILRLTPAPALPAAERRAVLAVARAAFQLRRKTLRHGAARAAGGTQGGSPDAAAGAAALERAALDPSRRPETLDLEEWRRLARALGEEGVAAPRRG